jgi:putative transposase
LKNLICIAGLARSVFYYWEKQLLCSDKYADIKRLIRDIYHQHKGRYGYRRVCLTLKNSGYDINHKTILKLMRQLGLQSIVRPKRYKSYRGRIGKMAPNILSREFSAALPCEKWVTDITEFHVNSEKMYLSPILDLYNGEIIAYDIQPRPCYALVSNMLEEACNRLKPTQKPLLHSDQGWHYQLAKYQAALTSRELEQSMSRKGNCLDNAVMENFFGILKTEFFYTQKFENKEVFIKELKEYIHYYNHDRIKQKLKGLSPVQYRIQSFS